MRRSEYMALGLIVLAFALGVWLYPQMPDRMASHWNARWEVDGYMPKVWSIFLIPVILAGLLVLFILIPKIDPLKKNIQEFRKYYDIFVVLIVLFLFYIHVIILLWNLGTRLNMNLVLSPALAGLFYYCGILIENAKRNWFIGIRTPWTLSSDRVWEKTHRIGGKLFKAAGLIALAGVLLPDYAMYFILAPVLLVTAYTVVYSYLEYRKEE
ncbi:MAG: SdpI family protein [Candidatus Altiarchaeota archaeon]|nr:SdpI family protein [Candidatus Altiarchaeota archaeon]